MYDDEFPDFARHVELLYQMLRQGKGRQISGVMRHREADDSFPFRQQASEIAREERRARYRSDTRFVESEKLGATFRLVSAVD